MTKDEQHSVTGSTTITALIVVAIVAITLSGLAWKQRLEIRQLENTRDQLQVAWLQKNLVDFARVILRDDFRINPAADHLGEVWALPIAESRIADFLKSQDLPDEIESITLQGRLTDAQSMFNLQNLWGSGKVPTIDANALQIYSNLLNNIGLDKELANQTVNFVLRNNLKPLQLNDLAAFPGYSSKVLNQLRPFVTVLPEVTPVNLNTCSLEVILAVYPFLSRAEADKLIQTRNITPFNSKDALNQRVNAAHPNIAKPGVNDLVGVKSKFWLVNSQIQMRARQFQSQALIVRNEQVSSSGQLTQVLWSKPTLSQSP